MTIDHIVVLMMENHSFDHMLGFHTGSIDGTETQPLDCTPDSATVNITDDAPASTPSPAHSVGAINQQLFCTPYPADDATPTMSGFIANYLTVMASEGGTDRQAVTRCFGDKSPVQPSCLWDLADRYAVCDNWFSSVPGPTTPNRLFANCASSGGYAGNLYYLQDLPPSLATTPSIFGLLTAKGLTWRIYYADKSDDATFCTEMILDDVTSHPDWCVWDPPPAPDPSVPPVAPSCCSTAELNGLLPVGLPQFRADVSNGDLANYTFLTPGLWYDSQHPAQNIAQGDALIGAVAAAVEQSTLWESTLLLIVYDEHGGYYDHVPPPSGITYTDRPWDPNVPDDFQFTLPSFDFTRLGARVPAIVVSATTTHQTDSTIYEHSSIVRTVCDAFGLPSLTDRDQNAASFLGLAASS